MKFLLWFKLLQESWTSSAAMAEARTHIIYQSDGTEMASGNPDHKDMNLLRGWTQFPEKHMLCQEAQWESSEEDVGQQHQGLGCTAQVVKAFVKPEGRMVKQNSIRATHFTGNKEVWQSCPQNNWLDSPKGGKESILSMCLSLSEQWVRILKRTRLSASLPLLFQY